VCGENKTKFSAREEAGQEGGGDASGVPQREGGSACMKERMEQEVREREREREREERKRRDSQRK
jgi:hypothetical protein